MPAHSSGAAAAGSSVSETLSTKSSTTVTLVEYPPYVICPGMFGVGSAVGEHRAAGVAVLLQAGLAAGALAARVHEAADGGGIADLELADLGPDRRDAAQNLVTRDDRVDGCPPLVARGVEVGVADAAVEDVDLDIRWTGVAAGDGERPERAGLVECGKGRNRRRHALQSSGKSEADAALLFATPLAC